jgi:hypothetical protein
MIYPQQRKETDSCGREAPKEDILSLEPLYRYLPEILINFLRKVRGYVDRLISYGGKQHLKDTLVHMGSQRENRRYRAIPETTQFAQIIA